MVHRILEGLRDEALELATGVGIESLAAPGGKGFVRRVYIAEVMAMAYPEGRTKKTKATKKTSSINTKLLLSSEGSEGQEARGKRERRNRSAYDVEPLATGPVTYPEGRKGVVQAITADDATADLNPEEVEAVLGRERGSQRLPQSTPQRPAVERDEVDEGILTSGYA
ncbi:unnamed protein product [Symbiodinium necroappetens]|uniref:Uncharacterized protein n=1 Tax=Symbiodinium necroappetens TaxID=1628268 RepID=A0A812SI22_9DINO|nr:unnamed protein product [Symbiodinium necroappetens]